MKKVLITGATGFVGTSLIHHFTEHKGINIVGHTRDIQKAKIKFADCSMDFIAELSAEAIDKSEVDTIIHLAGIAHDLSGKFKDGDYQQVNCQFTKDLFDEFLQSRASTFVFVSSVKAVVDHSDDVITEQLVADPKSPYGISKRCAEQYIVEHDRPDKQCFILRPCMIHGPGNKGNLNHLYNVVKVGIPYPLGAFENKRSFLSIDNFCFVIRKIIEGELKAGTYLLSDNEAISTNALVRLIGQNLGRKVRIWRLPKSLIRTLAGIGSWLHLPFNKNSVAKLTENMAISNQKLLVHLNNKLPVSAVEGLEKTIKSFND